MLYARGCRSTACVKGDLISIATSTAAKADAVVIVVGLNQAQEAEKRDRVSLRLPGRQEELILAIAGNVTRRVAIVVVVMSGGPLDMRFAKEDERIQSILWVGYPGEAGGQAISEVIFGDYNPGKWILYQFYTSITESPSETNKLPCHQSVTERERASRDESNLLTMFITSLFPLTCQTKCLVDSLVQGEGCLFHGTLRNTQGSP